MKTLRKEHYLLWRLLRAMDFFPRIFCSHRISFFDFSNILVHTFTCEHYASWLGSKLVMYEKSDENPPAIVQIKYFHSNFLKVDCFPSAVGKHHQQMGRFGAEIFHLPILKYRFQSQKTILFIQNVPTFYRF